MMDRVRRLPLRVGCLLLAFLVFQLLRGPSGVVAQSLSANTTTGVELVLTDGTAALDFVPRDSKDSLLPEQKVSLTLESIQEYSPADDQYYSDVRLIGGGWKEVTDTQYNASQSFVYSCPMTVGYYDGTPAVVQGTVELQFFLFDADTQVSVGAGLPFTVTPDLAKFSLRVTDYPWQGREDRQLEVRMSFSPALNRSTRSDNTPQEGITTFKLFGQQMAYPDKYTQVRLVEAVEIDGVLQTKGGVSYKMEDSRSRLVMMFSHFSSELLYDPDMGVLLGEDGNGGGSSDNTALIVCLAVILPIAAGIVILAGVAILVGYFMRKKRFPAPSLGGVELSEDHL